MVLRESAPVVVVPISVVAAPTVLAPPMAFVRLPVWAGAIWPALTPFGFSRPCLPPVLASAMSPHH